MLQQLQQGAGQQLDPLHQLQQRAGQQLDRLHQLQQRAGQQLDRLHQLQQQRRRRQTEEAGLAREALHCLCLHQQEGAM